MNAAIPNRRPETEEISGVIERVTFHSDESGFCVLRIKNKGKSRGDDGHRIVALRDRRGMAGRRRPVGQGQGARAAI